MGRRHRPLPAGSVVGGAMTGCLEVNRNAMPKAHTRRARVGATHASPWNASPWPPNPYNCPHSIVERVAGGPMWRAGEGDACVAPTRWG